jgi:hypothetical protein
MAMRLAASSFFENSDLFVGGFTCNAAEGTIWHLGPDGLGRDSV